MRNVIQNSLIVTAALFFPFCASAEWREGFKNDSTLQLVGEGKLSESEPQIRANAMAKEAAVMDALSHWIKFCEVESSADGIARFRIENQKYRKVECSSTMCRARVIIEKEGLRSKCNAK
ncbi:MAG TPA: hypothetical protein PLY93_11225 [Turneriella sp.]|nr:hypothetical protein [Turneriella sp.]